MKARLTLEKLLKTKEWKGAEVLGTVDRPLVAPAGDCSGIYEGTNRYKTKCPERHYEVVIGRKRGRDLTERRHYVPTTCYHVRKGTAEAFLRVEVAS